MGEFRSRSQLGDPILRALAAAEQKKRAAGQLAMRNATRAAADKLVDDQSRQVRRALARKGDKGRI